jgi:hypothetical protein
MTTISNVKLTFEDKKKKNVEIVKVHNVGCSAGMNSLASRMVGAEKGQVTYLAVGTGASTGGDAPDVSDTELVTELIRKQISVRSSSGDTASFRVFFNTSEANDTLTEIGLFGDDATVTADSGTLFARAAISKTKTDSETLTIDWELSIEAPT